MCVSFVCSHLEHLWMLKLGYPLISRTKRSLETLSPNDSSRIILAAPFRRSSLWSAYFKRMFISVRWVKSCTSLCGYPKLSWRALIAFRVENAPKSLTNNPSRISTLSSLRTNSSGVDWSGPIEGRQLCSTKSSSNSSSSSSSSSLLQTQIAYLPEPFWIRESAQCILID